ncbi:unnamed protein product [Peronospora effusa]|uniref:Uncharacterized protein n=1 Tax=Peronospora effusa TaxID=542832 RepID=A0A3M6VNB0_9STRA|nr:hypothetical protein DD238_004671 [Peronospora effusa]RQM17056.1 hypothetical protein DD237_002060 [Peronospora effusa]CAI5706574.1 unnamed protein product [Peronospora effusa]
MSTNNNNTAATTASDSNQTVALLPTEVRCSYPSKLCNNHRAVKDNGDLHKLCDFHRKKANVNQQRMQQKRRLIRQQMMERKKRFMDAAQAPMEYNAVTNTMEPKEPICNLSHEEVMMLEAMLFDDEDGEGYVSPGEDLAYAAGYAMNTSATSFMEQLNNNITDIPTNAVSEEMRCQYSSKRCLKERTHKKSGGLHKFCAMHREKANRNQMRLDHRRRVIKQQQREKHQQQQAHWMQQIQTQQQMPWFCTQASTAMAVGQDVCYGNRMQRSPVRTKPMSPPNMTMSMCLPLQVYQTLETQPQQLEQQPTSNLPLFDQHDLDILEAMLFTSDEEQNDATPIGHCSTPRFHHSPSILNV